MCDYINLSLLSVPKKINPFEKLSHKHFFLLFFMSITIITVKKNHEREFIDLNIYNKLYNISTKKNFFFALTHNRDKIPFIL